jgi:hypothetical protein
VVGDDEDDGNKSGRSKREPDGKEREIRGKERREAITQSWRNPSGETGGHRNSGWGGIKARRPHE